MEKIATRISLWGLSKGYFLKEDIDIIRFGIEVILSQVIVFLPIMIYMIQCNNIINSILMLLSFGILRVFNKGYHAKTLLGCFIATNAIIFYSISVSWLIQNGFEICIFILLIMYIVKQINYGISKSFKSMKVSISHFLYLNLVVLLLSNFGGIDIYVIFTSGIYALLLKK